MVEHAASTYKGMGIDLGSNKNLTIDAEPRERKNPRAVCYLVDIPSDVRLSVKPSGGFGDYRSLFHELGHALHYANTRENAFEFKYLGEPTVTETYAFLSEYLLINNAWVRLRTPMPVTVQKEFLHFQALYRMYFVRRYCAKVLYELQLYGGVTNPPGSTPNSSPAIPATCPCPQTRSVTWWTLTPCFTPQAICAHGSSRRSERRTQQGFWRELV